MLVSSISRPAYSPAVTRALAAAATPQATATLRHAALPPPSTDPSTSTTTASASAATAAAQGLAPRLARSLLDGSFADTLLVIRPFFPLSPLPPGSEAAAIACPPQVALTVHRAVLASRSPILASTFFGALASANSTGGADKNAKNAKGANKSASAANGGVGDENKCNSSDYMTRFELILPLIAPPAVMTATAPYILATAAAAAHTAAFLPPAVAAALTASASATAATVARAAAVLPPDHLAWAATVQAFQIFIAHLYQIGTAHV